MQFCKFCFEFSGFCRKFVDNAVLFPELGLKLPNGGLGLISGLGLYSGLCCLGLVLALDGSLRCQGGLLGLHLCQQLLGLHGI